MRLLGVSTTSTAFLKSQLYQLPRRRSKLSLSILVTLISLTHLVLFGTYFVGQYPHYHHERLIATTTSSFQKAASSGPQYSIVQLKTATLPAARAAVREEPGTSALPASNRGISLFQSPQALLDSPFLHNPTSDHGNDVIMLFVGDSYLQIFDVWFSYYQRLWPRPPNEILVVYALGGTAFAALEQRLQSTAPRMALVQVDMPIPVATRYVAVEQRARKDIWMMRMETIHSILQLHDHHNNILLTDVDAIWWQDPQVLWTSNRHADVVASRGAFPIRCRLLSRIALCMGWIYLRNTAATRYWVSGVWKALSGAMYQSDDQMGMNCFLRDAFEPVGRETLEWLEKATTASNNDATRKGVSGVEHENATAAVEFTQLITNTTLRLQYRARASFNSSDLLQLVVLPESVVVRHCNRIQNFSEPHVLHCLPNTKGDDGLLQTLAQTSPIQEKAVD